MNMQRYVTSCNTTADKQTDNVQHCPCCPIYKNIGTYCNVLSSCNSMFLIQFSLVEFIFKAFLVTFFLLILFVSDEKFQRIFKELFLIREVTKECCEEIKVTVLQKGDLNNTGGNEPTFLSTFQFPL